MMNNNTINAIISKFNTYMMSNDTTAKGAVYGEGMGMIFDAMCQDTDDVWARWFKDAVERKINRINSSTAESNGLIVAYVTKVIGVIGRCIHLDDFDSTMCNGFDAIADAAFKAAGYNGFTESHEEILTVYINNYLSAEPRFASVLVNKAA